MKVLDARTVTLSRVFMEELPYLFFASPEHISESGKVGKNEIKLSEKLQNARTVTLSQVITDLFPFLNFAIKIARSISLKLLKVIK